MRVGSVVRVAIACLVLACSDAAMPPDSGTPLPPTPFVVSNPVPGVPPASGVVPANRSPSSLSSVVYVSLPPGAIPQGVNANIRNLRTGSSVTAAVVDGGFDPVPLPAVAGDTLALAVQTIGNAGPESFLILVSATKRPTVVRTNPPSHKRDVPLNAIVEIVFSEPIDPATLTSATVQLFQGTTPVAGALAFADPTNLRVTFTPAAPLSAGTDYSLLVTQAIQDLNGEPLAAPATVEFETGSVVAGGPGIYLANADGSSETWLVRGNRPAWSPDGRRVAFDRLGEIRVIDTDGSDEVSLGRGTDPDWSPDGRSIAFADGEGISVLDLNTSATIQLIRRDFLAGVVSPIGVGKPAWSLDGESIAFEHYGDEDLLPGQIYIMNADGSSPHRMTKRTGIQCAESDPSWSPDGARLVLWSWCLGIAIAYPYWSGANTVYRNNDVAAYGTRPQFSPDGTSITFTGYEHFRWGDPAAAVLHIVAPNGSGLRTLIPGGYAGAWSRDGSRIAFVRGIP